MKNFMNSLRNDMSVTLVADFGGLPVPNIRRPWEVGCTITVPSDYKVCMQQMPAGNVLPFVPVVVTFPDGDVMVDKLFTGTLVKTACVAGTFVRNRGTVVDRIREFSNWDEAFRYGLAGRTFVVSAIESYEVPAFPHSDGYRRTNIYRFDFVKD